MAKETRTPCAAKEFSQFKPEERQIWFHTVTHCTHYMAPVTYAHLYLKGTNIMENLLTQW